jgi:hypothetical protein
VTVNGARSMFTGNRNLHNQSSAITGTGRAGLGATEEQSIDSNAIHSVYREQGERRKTTQVRMTVERVRGAREWSSGCPVIDVANLG